MHTPSVTLVVQQNIRLIASSLVKRPIRSRWIISVRAPKSIRAPTFFPNRARQGPGQRSSLIVISLEGEGACFQIRWGKADVARALLPAASALVPTLHRLKSVPPFRQHMGHGLQPVKCSVTHGFGRRSAAWISSTTGSFRQADDIYTYRDEGTVAAGVRSARWDRIVCHSQSGRVME
jgi:hypothetical protein